MYFNDPTGIFLCVEKPKNISANHSYTWSQVWYLLCPPTQRKDRIKQQKNNCEHSCSLAKLGKTSWRVEDYIDFYNSWEAPDCMKSFIFALLNTRICPGKEPVVNSKCCLFSYLWQEQQLGGEMEENSVFSASSGVYRSRTDKTEQKPIHDSNSIRITDYHCAWRKFGIRESQSYRVYEDRRSQCDIIHWFAKLCFWRSNLKGEDLT